MDITEDTWKMLQKHLHYNDEEMKLFRANPRNQDALSKTDLMLNKTIVAEGAAYLAKENQKLRATIADRFGIPEKEAVCQGCRNEGGKIAFFGMTGPCNVYRCIQKKGIKFCCDCSDFPCDHLHPYADQASQKPHNTKVFNLCLIKKMGLQSWAQTKAKSVRDTYFNQKSKL